MSRPLPKTDIRIRSGAWQGTALEFNRAVFETFYEVIRQGIFNGLNEVIPATAFKTGATRNALANMFTTQIIDIDGIQGNAGLTLRFDRALLELPKWLKYHDVEWELNPHFNTAGYKDPTTPGTRPFSEKEYIDAIFNACINQITIEFVKRGFEFIIKRGGRAA